MVLSSTSFILKRENLQQAGFQVRSRYKKRKAIILQSILSKPRAGHIQLQAEVAAPLCF